MYEPRSLRCDTSEMHPAPIATALVAPNACTIRSTSSSQYTLVNARPSVAPKKMRNVTTSTGRRPSESAIGPQNGGAVPWSTMYKVTDTMIWVDETSKALLMPGSTGR